MVHFTGLLFLAILDCIFRFLGLGWFLSVLTQIIWSSQTLWNLRNQKTDHNSLESEVYQIERVVIIISLYAMGLSTVPACVPACQHARSVPACQRVIPEVSELPRGPRGSQMSWRPRHCATVPDGSKPTRLYLWHNFYLKWWYLYCFTSHVTAYWLWVLPFNCKVCQTIHIVWLRFGLIMAITKFSLLTHICMYIH